MDWLLWYHGAPLKIGWFILCWPLAYVIVRLLERHYARQDAKRRES